MYSIIATNRFKKDYQLALKRGQKIEMLDNIIIQLSKTGAISKEYSPHTLKGNYKNYWECHIKPDWLLIWLPDSKGMTITLIRTGSHSDLF